MLADRGVEVMSGPAEYDSGRLERWCRERHDRSDEHAVEVDVPSAVERKGLERVKKRSTIPNRSGEKANMIVRPAGVSRLEVASSPAMSARRP